MADFDFYSLTLEKVRKEFDDIYTFSFNPQKALPFKAGQWLHLAAYSEGHDRSLVHHMSIATAPQDKLLEFSMDVGSGSPYKLKMAALKPGDQVLAFKVKGEFTIDPLTQHNVVFLAGGVGITPIRSLIRDLAYKKAEVPWSLLHVARGEFLYEEELKTYQGPQWRVNRAELDSIWPRVISPVPKTWYYLCGSDRFVEGMKAKLEASGVDPAYVRAEDFR